jgi:2-(1,2-epoxy-1,2-dihydrophenyl)acetyl-CoA isomerase
VSDAASERSSALRVEVADAVATLTLDRPAALNALDRALRSDLLGAIRRLAGDPAVRVLVLTGAGRAFCSGQDLREPTGGFGSELRDSYNPIILALRSIEKPVIAAVNGVAAGAGASIAFACDIRLAAEQASFLLAFGRVGLVPDSGATWLLPRLVGPGLAAELIMTTEPLSAEGALEVGLVSRVVPAERLADETRAIAERLATGAPRALALAKRALARTWTVDLAEALDYEAHLQEIAGRTSDHAEGVAAFLEKRPARFTGT